MCYTEIFFCQGQQKMVGDQERKRSGHAGRTSLYNHGKCSSITYSVNGINLYKAAPASQGDTQLRCQHVLGMVTAVTLCKSKQ